jgi:heme-degrading monooxygenase HmoA
MAPMIARVWHGSTRPADADRYVAHLRQNVVPELRGIEGFRGLQLLRRARGDRVDFIVTTMWESVEAIARFAGTDPEMAVVAPEAQAILTLYDRRAAHYDVVAV